MNMHVSQGVNCLFRPITHRGVTWRTSQSKELHGEPHSRRSYMENLTVKGVTRRTSQSKELHGEPHSQRRSANSVSPYCGVRTSFVDVSSISAAPGGPESGAALLHAPEGSPKARGTAWVLPQSRHRLLRTFSWWL